MATLYLDTHAAVWLYAGRTNLLGARYRKALADNTNLLVSPMVALEIAYLQETGRLTEGPTEILHRLHLDFAVTTCHATFHLIAAEACRLAWTRDPFDRIIVAHASLHATPLATRDRDIHANFSLALWD